MNNIPEGATHICGHTFLKRDEHSRNHRWQDGPGWIKCRVDEDNYYDDNAVVIGGALHPTTTTITAQSILEAAAGHMRDRAATYDKPEGERSMGATVQAFKAVTGHELTEEQGWLFMQLLKAVRSQQGAYRADSYEDGAAYVALAGEAAARDRQGDRS